MTELDRARAEFTGRVRAALRAAARGEISEHRALGHINWALYEYDKVVGTR